MNYAEMAITPLQQPLERGSSYFPPTPNLKLSPPSIYSQNDYFEELTRQVRNTSVDLQITEPMQQRWYEPILRWLCCGRGVD